GRGGATRHVDVHGYDAITAAHHRIRVVVVAAAVCTGAHGYHPARFGHLVVNLAKRGCHLVAQRASHDHHVRLTWTGPEDDAELVHVVTCRAGLHHLNRTTGQPKRHGPKRAGFRPVQKLVCTGRDEPFFHNAVDSHNSAYS